METRQKRGPEVRSMPKIRVGFLHPLHFLSFLGNPMGEWNGAAANSSRNASA